MELNPNHQVLRELHEHWQKIAAILVAKAGGHAVITMEDIAASRNLAIAVRGTETTIEMYMLDPEQALALARKEGGLPQ